MSMFQSLSRVCVLDSSIPAFVCHDRQRLHRAAEEERLKWEQIWSASQDKEKVLAEELTRQREKSLKIATEMQTMKLEFAESRAATRTQLQAMLDDLHRSWDAEKHVMEIKVTHAMEMLRQAHQDIAYLLRRNQDLEKELHQALAWEPLSAFHR
jgi:hypothetical protein